VVELLQKLFRIKTVESIIRSSQRGEQHLKKVLGPVDLVALGIGAIIGAGIFVITGTAAAGGASHLGAGPAIVISFIITGIACGFAALCYAEFASFIPIAGSAYTYSYATMGELVAWIIGWDLVLEYMVGSSTVAIGWSGYFKSLLEGFHIHLPNWITTDIMTVMETVRHPEKYIDKFGAQFPDLASQLHAVIQGSTGAARVEGMLNAIKNVPDISSAPLLVKFNTILLTYQQAPHLGDIPICVNLPAFLIITLVTILLVVGISESAKVNSFIVGLKLIILFIFIGVGIFKVDPNNWVPFAPNGIAGIQTGAAMIFFAYIGFDAVSTTAEEAKNPGRDLPIGIIGSFLTLMLLWETGRKDGEAKPFDLPGFITMSVAFGSFIAFLSKGQENGWLQSDFILALIIIFAVSLPLFIWIELTTEKPLFDLRIFKYRDFTISMLCMFFMSIAVYGIFMLIPMYMERFRQFTTLTTGLTMLPGSLMAGVGVMAAGYLSDKYNPKKLFFFSSIFMFIFGMTLCSIDQHTERSTIMLLFLLWNIPMAFNFPPIQAVGYNGIPQDKIDLVSCGQNVSRLLAGSVGTAISVTMLERRADTFFESFGRTVHYGNIAAMNMLRTMEGLLHYQGTPAQLLDKKALKLMELYITVKSYVYAVKSDIFWLTIMGMFAIFFALFIKKQDSKQGVKHVPMH